MMSFLVFGEVWIGYSSGGAGENRRGRTAFYFGNVMPYQKVSMRRRSGRGFFFSFLLLDVFGTVMERLPSWILDVLSIYLLEEKKEGFSRWVDVNGLCSCVVIL